MGRARAPPTIAARVHGRERSVSRRTAANWRHPDADVHHVKVVLAHEWLLSASGSDKVAAEIAHTLGVDHIVTAMSSPTTTRSSGPWNLLGSADRPRAWAGQRTAPVGVHRGLCASGQWRRTNRNERSHRPRQQAPTQTVTRHRSLPIRRTDNIPDPSSRPQIHHLGILSGVLELRHPKPLVSALGTEVAQLQVARLPVAEWRGRWATNDECARSTPNGTVSRTGRPS